MEDYSGLSPRCTILSATDDFSGNFMVGSCIDDRYRNVEKKKVIIRRFSQIGANSIVFPGVEIAEGVAVGAMSLVNKSLPEWSICYGTPAVKRKERCKHLLKYI